MTRPLPPTARARQALLSLAGLILLGTVLLWAGTRGKVYEWGTDSLPGGRGLAVNVGGGQLGFAYVDLKRNPDVQSWEEGFDSYPVGEWIRAYLDESPAFHWDTPDPGFVSAWCPVWFPGTLVGGLLLGWGLLCGRDGERISEPKEPR